LPFTIASQPGEEVYLRKEFRGSHGHVFAMAVSNQAIYVSAQRLVPKKDPWYFRRIPLGDVAEVRLVRQRTIYLVLLSALMIVSGVVLSALMMWRALYSLPGVPYKVSGWPFAIAIGGFIIPFIARGRRILIVKLRKGQFKWKPQLAVDKQTRELCARI
jgi:hypothetical protein